VSRILLVDDDQPLVRALSISLRARGYEIDVAGTGEEALDSAAHHHPDVILLDLGLPGIDGVDVIRGLRGWSQVPVIVLSARHQGAAKVEALDAGADDYVTKPFAMDELLARVRAALRRVVGTEAEPRVETADFVIDLAAMRVMRGGEAVHLTPKEWDVVALLVRHAGRLVSHRQILQEVWGPEYVKETEYLRVLLARVRRKLERDPSHPVHFLTEPGLGYRFEM
jgi:two-component system KDP operon response regulator KdpE